MTTNSLKAMFRRVACDLASVSWRINRCEYHNVCRLYTPENVGCHNYDSISMCGMCRELTRRRMPIHA
jgi:hypothetical protein